MFYWFINNYFKHTETDIKCEKYFFLIISWISLIEQTSNNVLKIYFYICGYFCDNQRWVLITLLNESFKIINYLIFALADEKTKCDRAPKHYEELGCKGVFDDGGDCPTRLEFKLFYTFGSLNCN